MILCYFVFWPISKSSTNFPCSLYSYLFYFYQLELCFYSFPPKTNITKYRTCIFLPIDITVSHLVTTGIMKCINTWKQKHKTKTIHLLPCTLFPFSGRGAIYHFFTFLSSNHPFPFLCTLLPPSAWSFWSWFWSLKFFLLKLLIPVTVPEKCMQEYYTILVNTNS